MQLYSLLGLVSVFINIVCQYRADSTHFAAECWSLAGVYFVVTIQWWVYCGCLFFLLLLGVWCDMAWHGVALRGVAWHGVQCRHPIVGVVFALMQIICFFNSLSQIFGHVYHTLWMSYRELFYKIMNSMMYGMILWTAAERLPPSYKGNYTHHLCHHQIIDVANKDSLCSTLVSTHYCSLISA